jgi:hypothetical protein
MLNGFIALCKATRTKSTGVAGDFHQIVTDSLICLTLAKNFPYSSGNILTLTQCAPRLSQRVRFCGSNKLIHIRRARVTL